MSIHESQSKLWENHVARNPAFAEVLAAELGAGGFAVAAAELHATLVGVEPSPIRVSADPLTYPLHIVLRFELELALIEGDLAVADLPARVARADAPPARRRGALRRARLPAGRALGRRRFGYFPSYALGCLIAAQLWETMEAELGPREEDLRHGEVGADPALARRARAPLRPPPRHDAARRAAPPDAPLEIEPFLRYVAPLAGG